MVWQHSSGQSGQARPGSVGEAATDYLEYLRVEKGEKAVADARGRINRYILPPFDKKPLDKLTTADIQKWLHAFVPISGSAKEIQQAKNSANRNLNTFKAILNWAHKNGLVASASAWSRVTRFKGVNAARQEFLTSEQVRKLISKTEGYFQDLVKAGALTGARYGELAQLKVKDIDAKAGVLNVRVGKTGPRIVPLTDNMQAFFNLMAKDKLPEAPLLTKDGVHQWGHSDQDKLMKQAVKAAKLPGDVVFYTLRHSYIANAISARMDIYSIAEITGTSISMIEKHYGKLLKERVREQMAKAALIDLTS